MKGDSFIYVIRAVEAKQIKIGYSDCPNARLASFQPGNGSQLEIIATARGGQQEEKAIHRRLYPFRLAREWFMETPEVMAVVEELRQQNDPWNAEEYFERLYPTTAK